MFLVMIAVLADSARARMYSWIVIGLYVMIHLFFFYTGDLQKQALIPVSLVATFSLFAIEVKKMVE